MKTGGSEGERELETRWRASKVLWVFRKNTAVVEDVERHWGTTLPGKVYMGVFFTILYIVKSWVILIVISNNCFFLAKSIK